MAGSDSFDKKLWVTGTPTHSDRSSSLLIQSTHERRGFHFFHLPSNAISLQLWIAVHTRTHTHTRMHARTHAHTHTHTHTQKLVELMMVYRTTWILIESGLSCFKVYLRGRICKSGLNWCEYGSPPVPLPPSPSVLFQTSGGLQWELPGDNTATHTRCISSLWI